MAEDPWKAQLEAFGSFVRTQRQLANLSLRELADLATVSNPYLSQIERGLHEPSIRIIKAIANALDISTETLLAQAGLVDGPQLADGRVPGATEAAIGADPYLSDPQKDALLTVYRSYVAEMSHGASPARQPSAASADEPEPARAAAAAGKRAPSASARARPTKASGPRRSSPPRS